MPIKMDEGTLLAVLNAAATQADGQLARDTWALLVRSLVLAFLVSDSVLTMQIDTQRIDAMQIVKLASEIGFGLYVA